MPSELARSGSTLSGFALSGLALSDLTAFGLRLNSRFGRGGRNGRGVWAPGLTSIAKSAAICGIRGASRLTVCRSASVVACGAPRGLTEVRIGEKARASRIAIQRSELASFDNESAVAFVSCWPRSTGNSTPALGGSPESLIARNTRVAASAALMSSSH